jgi:hypothetical protein
MGHFPERIDMVKSHDNKREITVRARWETPTLRCAGHLGTVLQAKCIISSDDTGIEQYKTPGHDSGANTCN